MIPEVEEALTALGKELLVRQDQPNIFLESFHLVGNELTISVKMVRRFDEPLALGSALFVYERESQDAPWKIVQMYGDR